MSDVHAHSPRCIRDVRTATGDLAWGVSCYQLVHELLQDPRLLVGREDAASAARVDPTVLGGADYVPVEVEERYRRDRRRGYARLMSSAAVSELRDVVERMVNDLVEEFCQAGPPGDLGRQVLDEIPVRTMAIVMGMPVTRAQAMGKLADSLIRESNEAKASEILALLEGEARRSEAYEALGSAARRARHFDASSSDAPRSDASHATALLFLAGVVTTRNYLRACVKRLVENKPAWQQLMQGGLSPFVEEVLRFPGGGSTDSDPSDGIARYAITDLEVADVLVRSGELVILGLRAANLDPEVFDEPGIFTVDRTPNQHLMFGFGRRACPGADLARLEMTALASALMKQVPRLAIEISQSGGASKVTARW